MLVTEFPVRPDNNCIFTGYNEETHLAFLSLGIQEVSHYTKKLIGAITFFNNLLQLK